MKKTAFRYGLIASALILAMNFAPLLLLKGNLHQYEWSEVLGYTGMVLGLIAVYFGIRHHRDRTLGGQITFGKALGLGALISVVAAICFVVADGLYVTVIDPDFSKDYCEQKIAALEAANAPPEDIQEVRDMSAMMQGPGGLAFLEVVMFFTVFLIGLGISLISAMILRRAPAT